LVLGSGLCTIVISSTHLLSDGCRRIPPAIGAVK
jgi:hypothetical protein